MKSAYELAMERLNKASPTIKLTAAQKTEIAELESKCSAKIAEREIAMKQEMEKAAGAGEFEKMEQLEKELVNERKKIQSELEGKKEKVRQQKK